MRKFIILGGLILSANAMFGAVACAPPPADVLTYNASGGCFAGPGLFQNFAVSLVTGGGGPVVMVSATTVGTDVTLGLNPNLNNPSGVEEDIVSFTATGLFGALIYGASSSNGGNPVTTVHQIVCSGTITLATGACSGTVLQDITQSGGQTTGGPISFAGNVGYASVSVWRDASAPGNATMTGGTTDLLFGPEPGMLMLVGSGLCGLALLRRKNRV